MNVIIYFFFIEVRPKSKLSVKKYLTKEDKNKDRSIQSRDETELSILY